MRRLLFSILIGVCAFLLFSSITSAAPDCRPDQILIQPKPDANLSALHASRGCKVLRAFERIRGLQVVRIPPAEDLGSLIGAYNRSGLVEFAEPDYIGHVFTTTPNDPDFTNGSLWALNNFGQSGGTPHADIDAVDAWDLLASASNIIVAVLDTGIRYTHEDLSANMWLNPNDNSHGTNAIAGNTDPSDDSTHGTAVAGVIGGVGNNGKGVTGVAWRVQLMSCTCFDSTGHGTISDTVACFDYARANGARIINASFGFAPSLSLSNAVSAARDAGIVVIAACGNAEDPSGPGTNIDANPPYPAGIHLDNVLSVAATDRNDQLASFSNYGPTNVQLAAPGVDILSAFPATDSFYYAQSGTSFAAPYVSGACALAMARFPAESHQTIISRILNGVDPLPSLAGKCSTGGRLNLRKALSPPINLSVLSATDNAFAFRTSAGPNRTVTIQSSSDLLNWSPLVTNTTAASGIFDFTDTNPPTRFYRAVSRP